MEGPRAATGSPPGDFEVVDREAALRLSELALTGAGASSANAACVARHLVDAELAGHPSHGLRLVPRYCELAGTPGHRLDAVPAVSRTEGALSVVDAAGGLGYPALEVAVDAAAASALALGIGACSVIRCGHAGRAGAWAERAVRQGAVAIVLLGGADPPFVMAAGPGSVASLHTNPVAIGVPADGPPLILDMATSLVAEGKVAIAASRGTELPAGAIVARDGTVTADPAAYDDGGALLPFAGHKGFGLAAMVEALSVSLTGAGAGEPAEGALVICLNASGFRPESDVRTSIEALRVRLHASGREADVLAPGEPEARAREASAVLVETEILARIRDLADLAV
jgi:LDH2 family malate/lactate/ureidoglycolate dehydrogenase